MMGSCLFLVCKIVLDRSCSVFVTRQKSGCRKYRKVGLSSWRCSRYVELMFVLGGVGVLGVGVCLEYWGNAGTVVKCRVECHPFIFNPYTKYTYTKSYYPFSNTTQLCSSYIHTISNIKHNHFFTKLTKLAFVHITYIHTVNQTLHLASIIYLHRFHVFKPYCYHTILPCHHKAIIPRSSTVYSSSPPCYHLSNLLTNIHFQKSILLIQSPITAHINYLLQQVSNFLYHPPTTHCPTTNSTSIYTFPNIPTISSPQTSLTSKLKPASSLPCDIS